MTNTTNFECRGDVNFALWHIRRKLSKNRNFLKFKINHFCFEKPLFFLNPHTKFQDLLRKEILGVSTAAGGYYTSNAIQPYPVVLFHLSWACKQPMQVPNRDKSMTRIIQKYEQRIELVVILRIIINQLIRERISACQGNINVKNLLSIIQISIKFSSWKPPNLRAYIQIQTLDMLANYFLKKIILPCCDVISRIWSKMADH